MNRSYAGIMAVILTVATIALGVVWLAYATVLDPVQQHLTASFDETAGSALCQAQEGAPLPHSMRIESGQVGGSPYITLANCNTERTLVRFVLVTTVGRNARWSCHVNGGGTCDAGNVRGLDNLAVTIEPRQDLTLLAEPSPDAPTRLCGFNLIVDTALQSSGNQEALNPLPC